MASDRLKMPPQRDLGFYQRKKHDKWREVPPPQPPLEAPVCDSHAHLHMLPDPVWELVRCSSNGVDLVCSVADPSEDDIEEVLGIVESALDARQNLVAELPAKGDVLAHDEALPAEVVLALGVHPHNARLYDDCIEQRLVGLLQHPSVRVLGEVGLDYHYDLSPRAVQKEVFRQQIRLAKQGGLPLALHLRGGEDPDVDNAHRDAFAILEQEGFPEAGTLLHCCALGPLALQPWIDAGCYVAYGGALTFKNAEEAREGAKIVPLERLLLETDAPYMTPEPMRGAACTPAHAIFTAAALAEVRDVAPGPSRQRFLSQIHQNSIDYLHL